MPAKGEGLAYKWLVDHLTHPDKDQCLIWPFCRVKNGRGSLGHNGEHYFAHRLMCQLVHGDPPTPKHHAAHSCGKGHLACVSPWHLSWKTPSENLKDCAVHGTHPKSRFGARGRFSAEQIGEIRELLKTHKQRDISEMLGVHETTIGNIATGRFYSRPHKLNYWTAEEDDRLRDCISRGLSFPEIAKEIGRPKAATMGRIYRIGLTSGRPPAPRRVYKSTAQRQGD